MLLRRWGFGAHSVKWKQFMHQQVFSGWLITTGVFWKTFYHSFASCDQGCWAGWGERPMRKKRKRRTRRRTKSQRTPAPPRSPRVTRRAKRRTSRRPQLSPQPLPPRPYRRPRHVRAAENLPAYLLEQLWLMSVVDLVSVCCLQPSRLSLPLNLTQTIPILTLVSDTHQALAEVMIFYSYSHIYNQGVALAWLVKQLTGSVYWIPAPTVQMSKRHWARRWTLNWLYKCSPFHLAYIRLLDHWDLKSGFS